MAPDPFNGNGVARELSKRIDTVQGSVERVEDKFDNWTEKVDGRFETLGTQVTKLLAAHASQQRRMTWRMTILPSILIGSGTLIMGALALVIAHV